MSAVADTIDATTEDQLERALELRVMPLLRSHGGGVELRSLDDGVLTIGWRGACVGCPLRAFTTVSVLEPALLEVDGVERIDTGVNLPESARKRIAACAPNRKAA